MKICGIYKITSPSNKVYIGQSIDIIGRFSHYRAMDCKKQLILYNSLKKYGVENHKFEILCQCSREELNNLEVYYIELYQSFNNKFGMNLRGGGGVSQVSEETKIRMSNAQKGNKNCVGRVMTQEHKNKIGDSNKGKKHSAEVLKKLSTLKKGKKLTEEHKRKVSEGLKGRVVSEETRKKISNSNKGKRRTAEQKQKCGVKNIGNKRWVGRVHTAESKEKMRISALKRFQTL